MMIAVLPCMGGFCGQCYFRQLKTTAGMQAERDSELTQRGTLNYHASRIVHSPRLQSSTPSSMRRWVAQGTQICLSCKIPNDLETLKP